MFQSPELSSAFFKDYNRFIRNWTNDAAQLVSRTMLSLTDSYTGEGAKVKGRTRKEGMRINRASLNIAREVVWVQKGVGRGYTVIPKGSGNVVRTAKYPATGKTRVPKDVFNGPLLSMMDELAQGVADETAKLFCNQATILNNDQIFIK